MMRSNGVSSEKELQFTLGDVVLCRYSSYPYWPATVDQTHQQRFKGKHFAMLRTRGGDQVPCFWCTFSNEDTGGWVREDRMVSFHPDIISKVRVDKDSEWYDDQKEAIESALKSFKVIHKENVGEAPQLPPDLAEGKHNGKWDATDDDDIVSDKELYPEEVPEEGENPMDLGGSDDEEDDHPPKRQGRATKAEKTPARPKAKKEPRKIAKRKSVPAEEPRPKKRAKTMSKLEKDLLDSIDNDPEEPRRKGRDRDVEEEVVDRAAGKRRRHSYAHSSEPSKKARKMELELANAKETISALKKTLKKREKALAELTGNGAGVACVMPPMAPPVQQDLPPREKYRSAPVDTEKFNAMMDSLMDNFDGFKKSAESADQARTELEKTMATIKKLYDEACEKVSSAEEKATDKERDVVRDLSGILEADVSVNNLRERKAGHVVRAMLKKCKDLPAIRGFCEAIYKSWKVQVTNYMKENEGKLKQESPKGVKSTGEKDDAKSSGSPSAEAKASSKDKAEEEGITSSPAGESDKHSTVEDKDVVMSEAKSDDESAKNEKESSPVKVEGSAEVKEEKQKTPDVKPDSSAEVDESNGNDEKVEKLEESSKAEVGEKAGKSEEAVSKPEEAVSKPEEAVSKPEEAVSKPEEAVSKPEEASKPEVAKPEKVGTPEKPKKESSDEPEEKPSTGDEAKRQNSAAQEAPDSGNMKKSDLDSTMEDKDRTPADVEMK